jgi:hypothetical protein
MTSIRAKRLAFSRSSDSIFLNPPVELGYLGVQELVSLVLAGDHRRDLHVHANARGNGDAHCRTDRNKEGSLPALPQRVAPG